MPIPAPCFEGRRGRFDVPGAARLRVLPAGIPQEMRGRMRRVNAVGECRGP